MSVCQLKIALRLISLFYLNCLWPHVDFHRSFSVDYRRLELVVAFGRKSKREVISSQLGQTGKYFRTDLAELEVVLEKVSTAVAGTALVQDNVLARVRKAER